jgi:hypothetical protein
MPNPHCPSRRSARWTLFGALALSLAAGAARAAENEWTLEIRGRYRSSDDAMFRPNFPFSPDMIPAGQEAVFLRTVDPGDNWEVSAIVLQLESTWSHGAFGIKIDGIDLDDRNPTSSADEWDIDELWLRLGTETETATLPERSGAYAKIGKFPRFERQDDRHLESYGVVATAFNRFEDVGLEVGLDLGRLFYFKASYTQGNPLFLRDTNALAGDNGTPEFEQPNPRPKYNNGIPIPYDTDVHDLDFAHAETSAGLGLRLADATGRNGGELLAWHTEREMAETVDIPGSFYGGDLDLLRGPLNLFSFPITSKDKTEDGVNLWLYLGGFSFFAQAVDQDLAGLPRKGFETEMAWRFDLPPVWAVHEHQVLPTIAPAVRYSKLDPDFRAPAVTPSPSFAWDWEKWDLGLRVGIVGRSDLTIEYSSNTFTLASGTEIGLDEVLATWRLRFGN